jgi:hypothetical protein
VALSLLHQQLLRIIYLSPLPLTIGVQACTQIVHNLILLLLVSPEQFQAPL